MDWESNLHTGFNAFFLIYGSVLFISYLLIGIISSFELKNYTRRNKHFDFSKIANFKVLPSISIIAPCYNEEKSIIQNVRSLLSLHYTELEVIVVNDGSTDASLELLIKEYRLVEVEYAYEHLLKTAKVRGVYKSTDSSYANLIIVDKENNGKGDSLNAGINISRSNYFLGIDVDCIIEPDALYRMIKPFLEEYGMKKVIASGGVIRVANSCKVENGQLTEVVFPKNIWAQFQILEYFRAFILSRMAWSKINGLLIISGAFGLFDRELVQKVGGYDTSTVGEDLELVIRMRKYMHEVEKVPYRIAFIPEPLCWTEVPDNIRVLYRQRNRWARGLIDSLSKHRKMFANPKYGRIGMVAFPFWVFFEWLGPILEFIGVCYFFIMITMGRVNIKFVILFTLFVLAFSVLYSAFAVFYEKYLYDRYKGIGFMFKIFFISILEILVFHPLNVFFALAGNYDFFIRRRKKGWGIMSHKGFKP
ncbi:glycosyltransferase [Carboxylicivirga sp. M1479]|uniref:glycosyltransferase family 2 protein n=1 Tax=Carboxylicivirga sp. M1479 TaxID=2594476 RepID=UPI001177D0DD|nr:glycosyltransferase [Carboxylicivirga sp. M1479]TRX62373.1 glycosyltransferase family 2 protein [Carboxylicivirga sp. M1479]